MRTTKTNDDNELSCRGVNDEKLDVMPCSDRCAVDMESDRKKQAVTMVSSDFLMEYQEPRRRRRECGVVGWGF
jgi:hypothetical protein